MGGGDGGYVGAFCLGNVISHEVIAAFTHADVADAYVVGGGVLSEGVVAFGKPIYTREGGVVGEVKVLWIWGGVVCE